MCVAKEMLPPTKVRFFFSPLKGGTIIIAAAQTENWGFCGQSKEKDEGKPNTYRLTVILVSLENKRCNLIEKPWKWFFFLQMSKVFRATTLWQLLLKKRLELTECLYVLLLPYSIFLVLKNTSQLLRVYFSFHCLSFSQTGGTLNLPVRRSLCINASSDLCSQTLIYWLSRTRVPLPPWNSETKPIHVYKCSLLQNIHDSGASAAWIIHDEECVINVWCAPTFSFVLLHNVDMNDNTSHLSKAFKVYKMYQSRASKNLLLPVY